MNYISIKQAEGSLTFYFFVIDSFFHEKNRALRVKINNNLFLQL